MNSSAYDSPDTSILLSKKPALLPALLRMLVMPRKGGPLPKMSVLQKDITIENKHLDRYLQLLNFKNKVVPMLYPHAMLGAHHLYLLGHSRFPFSLLGAVHTQNRIVQHAPLDTKAPLQIELNLGSSRKGKGFIEFDMSTRIFQHSALVWEELSVFKQRSKKTDGQEPSPINLISLQSYEETDKWLIDPRLGPKYAMICHDFNPIHLSALSAKLFGMQKSLAHGMAVLAQITNHINETIYSYPRTIDAVFKGPVPLGSQVRLVRSPSISGRYDLYVQGNDKPVICALIQ